MKFKLPNLFKSSPTEKKSTSLPSAADGYSLFKSSQGFVYAFQNYSIAQIIANYQKIAPLAAAVDKLANAAASLPITMIDLDTSQKVESHPAFKLLQFPNMDYQKVRQALIRSMISWKVLDGDIFLVVTLGLNKQPLELHILNSDLVTPTRGKDGYANTLNYYGNDFSEVYTKDITTGMFKNDRGNRYVLHIANFNPVSGDLEGLSELKALANELNQYLLATEHNVALLNNGAMPSGAFILKDDKNTTSTLSDEEYNRLKFQISNMYTGAANAGNVLVLEGGLEWQPMSLSPKDLDFETLKSQAEEQIYKKLDIPVQLISSKQTTAGNTSNLRLEFYQNRVIPMLEEILAHMNKYILPFYKDTKTKNLEYSIDKEEIDVLADIRIKKRDAVEKSTTLTINEKRKMYKLADIKGGNVIIDPNGRHIAGDDAVLTVGQVDANKTVNPTTTKF